MQKVKTKNQKIRKPEETGPALQVFSEPQKEEMLKMLHSLEAEANSNNLSGLLIVSITKDNRLTWSWHGLLPEHVISLAERLKFYVLNTIFDK